MSDETERDNSVDVISRGGDAVEVEEDFAALLEKSGDSSERLSRGQKVTARVVSISGDFVYVDLGGKTEGSIDIGEFVNEEGVLAVKEGDEVDAFFVSVQDGIRRLTTMVNGYSAVTLKAISDAFEAGVPVNGEVKREVKGGFEVSVGGVRCFCPFSQIDLKGGREGGVYLGRSFPFNVLEYEENGRNIIVSRRARLEEERRAKIEELRETLTDGQEITGPVVSIQNFGAFVDLGGIAGLIPASEISWDRAERPGDVLAVGQNVTVRIISLDWEKNRLTLSLKAMQQDPWADVSEKYVPDSRTEGTIVRLAPFGAFVRLAPGVEGLVHISNLGAGRRINHPREVVEAGQAVEVYVLSVDAQNRKISLSLQPKPKPEKVVLPEVGELVEGVVEKVMPFGIFIKTSKGVNGLIPNSEAGTQPGADHKGMFPAGAAVRTIVTEVDAANKRIRASLKAVTEKQARREYEQYVDSVKEAAGSNGGLGNLGEILKAKIEEKRLQG
ncbi:MAG: S1 RNA-binding domain-containing protein [Candidatus Sulfobium sp.]|jgi:small subunit ribosomal protein S1